MSPQMYGDYSDSGVEWLGVVPSHWRVERLKYACTVFPSNVDKHSRDDEPAVRLCNYTDVYYNECITADMPFMEATASQDQIAKFTLKAGDTIITKDSETADDIAVSAYVSESLPDVVCGYHLSMVRPRAGTVGAFVKRLFDSAYAKAKLAVAANGLTRVGLGQYALDNVELPFPPFDEQAAIAAFLDRETAKIDVLIAEQEKLIALLAEKRQATISHAVTKGLNPSAPMKDSGIAWLGEVPAHWEMKPLRYCVDYQEGPGILAEDFHDDGVPLLRVAGVRGQWASLDGCNYLDPDKVLKRWAHFRLCRGDLLISASASMGTICEVGEEAEGAIPYTGIIRMRGRDGGMVKNFLRHMVVSRPFLTQIDLLKAGATIQHYGPTHLSQMFCLHPAVAEQHEIADFIDQKLAKIDSLSDEAECGVALLQERRAALIAAAVTGQIDVRSEVVEVAI
ncbi:restriction endonuclease subunit S [Xanthomonas campestris]|uniref:restriction endonuclease subunit S n=1 Tax=Xanthomonas campestris TaxID=339 RepID=UPI00235861E7|nr:restriction endonuclease subunit S [Xanthomonas campestris]MDC8747631.1 restriction endonuclease subunit S [Xanthomonas campestris]